MKRNMDQWLEELTQSKDKAALPIMTFPGLELVDKKVIDIVTDSENQFKCIEALCRKYPTAAAVTTMDLSVEAEAFGSRVKFSDNEVPTISGKIIDGLESAENLIAPKVGDGRTKVYLRASETAAKAINDRPIFGGMIGPFSLAGRLMEMTEIMIAMMEEPVIVHLVLEKSTRFLIEYAKAFKDSGANGIIIAEPMAGLLPPAKCDEFSSLYLKSIVAAVQDENFLIILHNCGNTLKLVNSMLSTGAKGLHFGNAVAMKDILPQIRTDRFAFGNIDPVSVFRNGSAEEIKEKVTTLLNTMQPYQNFVLSSGCDIPPGTPLKNIDAFFEALKEYNLKGN